MLKIKLTLVHKKGAGYPQNSAKNLSAYI